MPETTLPYPDYPYRFDLLLEILRRFVHPARQVIHNDRLWRMTAGCLVSYHHTDKGIIATTHDDLPPDDLMQVSRHILGLDIDLTQFYVYAQSEELLWQVVEPLYGLPIFRTETIFEAIITLIIEQHISWKNALRAQQTLMQIFETEHDVDHITVYDFPSLAQIAKASASDLKPLKITNKRIDLILQIARDVVSGDLDLHGIQSMDTDSAYKELLKIKGVGHWTANNVLGRALGQFPHISHNDVALQAAVLRYFHEDNGKKSAQQTIDTLSQFGDYAELAGHFTLLRWVLDRYPVV